MKTSLADCLAAPVSLVALGDGRIAIVQVAILDASTARALMQSGVFMAGQAPHSKADGAAA